MQVTQVNFEDGRPVDVTVRMTMDEAIYLAKLQGKQTGHMEEETWPGKGPFLGGEVYGCLVGDFFNRFWDDGVDGALRGDSE